MDSKGAGREVIPRGTVGRLALGTRGRNDGMQLEQEFGSVMGTVGMSFERAWESFRGRECS